MTSYILRDGRMVCKDTGTPMLSEDERNGPVSAPLAIIKDIPAHIAPSGAYISGRKAMLDDCKAHGYVPWEKVSKNPGGFTNESIAKRNGVRVCEATREFLHNEKQKLKQNS